VAQLTAKERRVLELIPVGRAHAIQARRLAQLVGHHERKSRAIINHLVVVHGLPIGSSPEPGSAGYFVIADEEDLSVATRSIKPRAIKMCQRARALEKLAQQMFNRQLQLLFDFED